MVDAALGFLFPAVRTTLEFLFSEVVAQKKLVRQVKKEIGVLIHDRHPAGDVLENHAYPAWHRREMSESIQDINDIEDLRKVLGSAHGVRERLRRWAAFRDIGPDIDRIRKDYKLRKDRRPAIQEAARAAPVARAARAPPVARARLPGIDDDQLAIDCHKSWLKSMLAEVEAAGDGVAVEEHIRPPIRLVSIVSADADRSMATSVANGVYDDLKEDYMAAALVFVSSASSSIGILRCMYHKVKPPDEPDASLEWDEKRITQEIRNVLENKRYLIIFIDTDKAAWIRIGHILNGCVPFEESNRGSNIIITNSCYNIFLSSLDAESRISRGQYHLKHTLTEYLLRMGTAMPCDEMTCLLYLSIFPKKHPIERDDLIRRWIAEDFVPNYVRGDIIFSDLINAGIILSTYAVDTDGRVQAYHVDELVLKFITCLADEQEFVARSDSEYPRSPPTGSNNNVPGPKYIIYPPFNIVALPNEVAECPESEGFYSVRSLSVFSPHISFQLPLWRFRFLHVLYLEDCSSRYLKGIGKLIFLRYLRLSGAGYLELPEEIRKLQLLQTLDLKQTGITKVPKVVVSLPELVRLWVSPETKLPDGIMHAPKLNELSEVDVGKITRCMKKPKPDSSSKLEVLEVSLPATSEESPLNGLPASLLGVRVSTPGLSVVMTRNRKEDILGRFTVCSRRPCLPDPSSSSETSPFLRLPGWIDSETWQLSGLCIRVKALKQADLDSLRECGALLLLDLHVEEDTQEVVNITVSGGAFKRLEDFNFTSRARGVVLEGGPGPVATCRGQGVVLNFENGAMPKVQRLSLGVHVPGDSEELGLQYLASLKTAHIRIDCRDATVWQVSTAEAALWVAANRGRQKSVTLDFPRDSETKMKQDECTVDEDGHRKSGLWGEKQEGLEYNKDGEDERPHRLESLTVWTGEVVDALQYSYLDGSGQPCYTDRWGGTGGKKYTFKLGPEEFLERVSGTIHRYKHESKVLTIITSLTFVTNLCQHGPLGKEKGHRFHIPRQGNGRITGFFVRAGIFVDAIGVYTCADPHCVSSEADLVSQVSTAEAALWIAANQDQIESVTLDFPQDFETKMKQDECTGHDGRHAKSSLWGSKVGGHPCDIDHGDIPHRLESLTVWAGAVVDALKFSYLDGSGQPCFTDRWGGNGGKEYKFKLGPEEFLEQVSGTIDQYQDGSAVITIITSLTFVTNLCQHGPLGVERGHHFHIPRQGDGRITGFFLRAGKFVDAIGAYICAHAYCISSVTDLLRNTSS